MIASWALVVVTSIVICVLIPLCLQKYLAHRNNAIDTQQTEPCVFFDNKDTSNNNSSTEDLAQDVDCQVVIVGGGPVGLLLASRLLQLNIHVIVLENREHISSEGLQHSKAIGIHPPSLELFHQLDSDLVNKLCQVSVVVKDGMALSNGYDRVIGSLRLDLCRKPFNFVLSCPQHKSEQLLRDTLHRQIELYNNRNGTKHKIFYTGVSVEDVELVANSRVMVKYSNNESSLSQTNEKCEQQQKIVAHFAVGCDGKKSIVREKSSNITYTGSAYCDTFVMGDFEDNTHYAHKAAIFLADEGLVECFPLPNNLRRWVCSTDSYIKDPSRELLCDLVKNRTKFDISDQKHTMLSSFGVQGFVVNRFYDNTHCRFVLAGDAAHICSPLGGQGMNLGWMDAWELANTFDKIFSNQNANGVDIRPIIEQYNRKQMKMAKAVIHRAEMNMMLGRKPKYLRLRNLFVRLCLIPFTPLQYTIASFFTMRWLGKFSMGERVFA